jgi:hypothetical protein
MNTNLVIGADMVRGTAAALQWRQCRSCMLRDRGGGQRVSAVQCALRRLSAHVHAQETTPTYSRRNSRGDGKLEGKVAIIAGVPACGCACMPAQAWAQCAVTCPLPTMPTPCTHTSQAATLAWGGPWWCTLRAKGRELLLCTWARSRTARRRDRRPGGGGGAQVPQVCWQVWSFGSCAFESCLVCRGDRNACCV